MHKCFYFICPTDCLVQTINSRFKHENYFYTSLGNSFVYDCKTLIYIKQIIEKHGIREICFVLSVDNIIVLDAIGVQEFSDIKTLNNCYNEIIRQKEHSKVLFQRNNTQFLILSYYLNKKISELQLHLTDILNIPIKIRGKIYDKNEDSFTNIYSNLICLQKHHFN